MHIQHENVIILGSGPAGYTAAIYAARAMLKPLVIAGIQPGGQMTMTTDVENYPGFAETIQGPHLMEQMQLQAMRMGARIVNDHVTDVDLSCYPFRLTVDNDRIYECDALIIGTGAKARWLGLPTEEAFRGFGVSACATCDGFFYRDKTVLVIGGGNTAVEEAIFLTKFASKVTIAHRRNAFSAERILQEQLLQNEKIDVRWCNVLEEVIGTEQPRSVTGAILRNVITDKTAQVKVDGIFIAIGHAPETSLFQGQLNIADTGYIFTDPDSTKTSRTGVFAAGDVTDDTFKQAITAAGMGCMAALECERFLSSGKKIDNQKKE